MTTIPEMVGQALKEHQAGNLQQAEQLYRQILAINPCHPDGLHLLGVLISNKGRHDLAVSYIEQAIIVKPGIAAFHNNAGFSYQALGRLEEAEEHFHQALRLQPDFAMAHNNLGKAYREQGKLAEAMERYEKAISLQPDYAEAHFNRAELRLLQGDYERGWPEYDWRWSLSGVAPRPRELVRWDGSPLEGRTIMLHGEQGLGDTLQFIRYVPMVKQRGATVMVRCQASLLRLLAGFAGIDRLLAWQDPMPPFDVHEHLLNLPAVFHTTLDTIPNDMPYLHADAGLVEQWRRELDPLKGFKIGISWMGSPKNLSDYKRSIPLSYFGRLADIPGVQLVSLQKGPGTEQLEELKGQFPILDLGSTIDEAAGGFMDTAAIMKNLDLVIACDTAIPHLAAALGVRTWVLLPLAPDWRWLLERDDSPWYPTVRLFRQERYGDWDNVFARIAYQVTRLWQS